MAKVRHLLEEQTILAQGEKVVLAVSGGLDSMVLLDLMDRLRREMEIELHVAHLDHRLRPESAADSLFVAREADRRGLPCTCGSLDVAGYARRERLSLEDGARRLRYRFLDEVARETGAGKIALGHHAGDQAETVVMHLLRGSGARGLGGMETLRQGRYLRPMLEFERGALEEYAREASLDFREDSSNADLRFVRNRIRHRLMPQLQRYNPGIVGTLQRTASLLREEDDFLEIVAGEALENATWKEGIPGCGPGKIALDASRLLGYHIAVQRRIVRKLLQGLSTREGPFDFDHVERVLGVARRPDSGLHTIAAGLAVQRAGELLIVGRLEGVSAEGVICIPGETAVPEGGISLHAKRMPASCFSAIKLGLGRNRAVFDAALLGTELCFRNPCPGDRFQPLGMTGHKKLSDFFIDRKWPRLLRDELLLLTRPDGEIVWVVGLRPGHSFRVRPDTQEIVLVEWRVLLREEGRGLNPY
jgi:tRNA(Ile)-lysidine synthase